MNVILPLECISQNYGWGNYGDNSTVARLLKGGCDSFKIEPKQTYAELWMGSHPSGPSKVHLSNGSSPLLSEYIKKENPNNILGKEIVERFGGDFPFLFKVLSIRTALSIQSHPDSELAKQLHAKFPEIYKDPYHKPEIAIALTPFHALCGFRNLNDIIQFIQDVPEFKSTLESGLNLTEVNKDNCKIYLKTIVTSLLNVKQDILSENLKQLNNRLSSKSDSEKTETDRLVLQLYSQYPGDVGVFFAYILNYMVMQPGQALFLAAGEPHAYISGDCVECMAPSDNVVRAGLTPKLKDVNTLGEMLTYTTGKPDFVQPILEQHHNGKITSNTYRPPVDEFEVEQIDIQEKGLVISIKESNGPSILLVTHGNLTIHNQLKTYSSLPTGSIFFIPSKTQYQLEANEPNTTAFIAKVNQKLFTNPKL
ncbi:mannose-6-phosphate isomerase [Tieghemostelium lacteum]|uniref:mannose-6-phosphate isomerase n=1 Tax=Tieghemostelium lacteum TaxID=361077 RepID=A0A151ZJJ2_TIELA|nr:mannose-6-phosphate isomerase [Tieghemostelium lacteum]|eukprot:KYQ94168.1 mannose-6-phosphate isomerase [Tieghemostelium lacteum]